MTRIIHVDGTGDVEIWYLLNPRPTVSGSVIRHSLSTPMKRIMGIHALSGTRGPGTATGTSAGGTTISTAPTSEIGAIVLDVLYGQNSTTSYTADVGPPAQTERWDTNTTGGLNNLRGCGSEEAGLDATVTMGWTAGTSTNKTIAAVSFNPERSEFFRNPRRRGNEKPLRGPDGRWLGRPFQIVLDSPPPVPETLAFAEQASGTGQAYDATVVIAPTADLAAGTGQAYDATITTAATEAQAGLASGTGQAYDATVVIAPTAGAVDGVGTANDPSVAVSVLAGLASGTGQAYDATGSTETGQVSAGLASGSGAAQDATIAITTSAGAATGSGAAQAPSAAISVSAGLASGAGTAYDAAASPQPPAGAASGSGTAYGPSIAITVSAGLASGTGTAYNVSTPVEAVSTGYPPYALRRGNQRPARGPDGRWLGRPFQQIYWSRPVDVMRQTADSGVGTDNAWTDTPGPTESGVGADNATVVKVGDQGGGGLGESLCGPYSGPVEILYDGIDITSCVIYAPTKFKSSAGGIPGTCKVRIRDRGQDLSFVTGRSLECKIEGDAHWTGYVTKVRRGYFFDGTPDSPGEIHRYFELDGVDLNVLFQRRVLYDKVTPTNVEMQHFEPGTPDNEIIEHYVQHHLDLSGDNISLAGVQFVGTPSHDDDIFGVAGESWGQFQRMIRFNTGAIDYIDPDRVYQHVDVDTATAPFGVTDRPSSASGSITDHFGRVVASGWGTGTLGSWTNGSGGSFSNLSVDGDHALADGAGDSNLVWQMFSPDAGGADVWTLTKRVFIPTTSGFIFLGLDFLDDPVTFLANVGAQVGKQGATETLTVYSWLDPDYTQDQVTVDVVLDEWAYLKLEWDRSTGEVKAKFWTEGDPEPGWLVSLPADPDFVYNEDLDLGAVFAQTQDDVELAWDWVNFDYSAPVSGYIGVRDLEIDFDGSQLRNDVMVWGAGQGAAQVRFQRIQDAPSIAEHGTWQVGQFLPTVYKQETVDRIADSYVYGSPQNRRGGKDDAVAVRFKTFERGLRVAQKIPVKSEVYGFTRILPIRTIEITFPTPTDPEFHVVASEEIDDPWSTLEIFIPHFDFDFDFEFDPPVFDGFWWDPPSFDQCATARQWRLPIEILVRGGLSFNETDQQMNWSITFMNNTVGTEFGFFFQNFETDRVDLHYWCFAASSPAGGGENWEIPAQFEDNEPRLQDYVSSGQQFYVRLRLEEDTCYVKAWMIGATEPSNWAYWVKRNANPPFQPRLLELVQYFINMNGGEGNSWRTDFIEVVQGYGTGVVGIDNFNRTVVNGIGTAFNGQEWQIIDPPGPGPDPALQWSVNGAAVQWESDNDGYFSANAYLSVPQNTECLDTFSRVQTGSWGSTWQQAGTPPFQPVLEGITVDGNVASIATVADPDNHVMEWRDNLSGDLPIEILWEGVRFRWNIDCDNWDVILQLSGEPDPWLAAYWCMLEMTTDQVNHGGGFYHYELYGGLFTSEGGGTDTNFWVGPTRELVNETFEDETFNIRIRLEPNAVRARIWQGASEPGTWTIEETVIDESALEGQLVSSGLEAHILTDGVDRSQLWVDAVTVVEGCGDVCFINPPAPDPPVGPVTGSLPQMPTPPGWNPAYTYFSTGGAYIVRGSSRVWLGFTLPGGGGGGVFLRLGVDYYEGPDFIAIDDSVDVSGKTVYCSYRAG